LAIRQKLIYITEIPFKTTALLQEHTKQGFGVKNLKHRFLNFVLTILTEERKSVSNIKNQTCIQIMG